jgi:hypothetical protein
MSVEIDFGAGQSVRRNSPSGILFQRNSLTYDDGTDTYYELVDGVLVEMGTETPLNSAIVLFLAFIFADLGTPRKNLAIGHQMEVASTKASARQPDLIVHTPESDAVIRRPYVMPRVAVGKLSSGVPTPGGKCAVHSTTRPVDAASFASPAFRVRPKMLATMPSSCGGWWTTARD